MRSSLSLSITGDMCWSATIQTSQQQAAISEFAARERGRTWKYTSMSASTSWMTIGVSSEVSIVSTRGRSNVGPKTIARFAAVIWFSSECAATCFKNATKCLRHVRCSPGNSSTTCLSLAEYSAPTNVPWLRAPGTAHAGGFSDSQQNSGTHTHTHTHTPTKVHTLNVEERLVQMEGHQWIGQLAQPELESS